MLKFQNMIHCLAVVAAVLFIAAAPCGAQTTGSLVGWGADSYGVVSGAPSGTFVAVAAGPNHAVAVQTDGTLVSWGNDDSGQVSGTPSGTFTAVAAGWVHSLAICADGTLVSWGDDGFGQVSGTPSGTFIAIAANVYYSIAIRTDGTLAAWGYYAYSEASYSVPAGTYIAVAAGFAHSLAIRTDGNIDSLGLLVLGNTAPPAGTFTAVAAGERHGVAIRADGSLVSWGADPGGGPPIGTFCAVAASEAHSVAIRTDGTLASWGNDQWDEVSGTPAGTYSAVVAGFSYDPASAYSLAIVASTGNQPPVITCNDPVALWSPNHELVDVGSAFSVSDPDGNPVTLTYRVFSDETEIPDTGDGTGRHAPDFKTTLASGSAGLFLRSERRATGNGRCYVVVITADDGNGGVTTAVCAAAVCPRNQTQESLNDVLAQAATAAVLVQLEVDSQTLPATPNAPPGLYEHGLSAQLGPNQ